jgi:glycine/serine hydroxymethyltransferase
MKEPEMEVIASLIDAALESKGDEKRLEAVARQVKELTDRFPFYNA